MNSHICFNIICPICNNESSNITISSKTLGGSKEFFCSHCGEKIEFNYIFIVK